ncbi:hypothetical protein [Hydrogenophaga taeniospiralis]|uniref:hypothetical protein n=1 Tax=Hydrogenophaga taeniospiralis TaxID=65656 RepID=UPI001CFB2F27|nr:hypothetical protein [Hydrogenophaga taeniospiralis]UCU94029.1 hypothetical protein KI616_25385 [Hydrogenophaga taeniospiralis]
MSLTLVGRRARLLAIRDLIDAGGGRLHAYGYAKPATGADATEAPLMTAVLASVSFELHATEASMTLTVETNVAVAGSPMWVRFVDGAGVPIMDLDAGLPGSGLPAIITDGQDPPSAQMWVGGVATITCGIAEPE